MSKQETFNDLLIRSLKNPYGSEYEEISSFLIESTPDIYFTHNDSPSAILELIYIHNDSALLDYLLQNGIAIPQAAIIDFLNKRPPVKPMVLRAPKRGYKLHA
jgi:hypothetical protein